mmetsp:Transcript_86744/g.269694  ORF Transcript_86744/g.269694 Transcript_86744/m.269694 type:complete len:214 (+) Transcript_86744:136-777(+)
MPALQERPYPQSQTRRRKTGRCPLYRLSHRVLTYAVTRLDAPLDAVVQAMADLLRDLLPPLLPPMKLATVRNVLHADAGLELHVGHDLARPGENSHELVAVDPEDRQAGVVLALGPEGCREEVRKVHELVVELDPEVAGTEGDLGVVDDAVEGYPPEARQLLGVVPQELRREPAVAPEAHEAGEGLHVPELEVRDQGPQPRYLLLRHGEVVAA